jgi:VanZ family protein
MLRFIFSIAQRWRLAIWLIYLGILATLSLIAGNDLPQLAVFAGFDKLVHSCLYFGLTLLGCWTLHAELKNSRIILIALFCLLWGLVMEISQLEMKLGRAFEWTDEVANGIGILVGIGLYLMIFIHYKKSLKTND